MAQPESSFKVCGLCSSLVDESVMLNENLRHFLEQFLGLDPAFDTSVLPAKVCTDCYQSAVDSLKFKEKVIKAVQKLKNTEISVSMILGRSASDMQMIKKSAKTKIKKVEEPTQTSTPLPKVAKKAEVRRNLGNAINESIESSFDSGAASSARRSGRKPPGIPQNAQQLDSMLNDDKLMLPSVVLSNKDRETAENFINRSSSGRPLKRKNPYSPPKVAETTPAASTSGASRSKRSRAIVNYNPPEMVAAPSSAPAALAAAPVGRRASRKSSLTKVAPAPDSPQPAKVKKEMKKKGAGTVQYYVDNGEPAAAEPEPEIIDVEDGDEEIFPSLGPYQCEICQQITETKQEFVAHIKSLHKDMVDEAVLRSLESDLNKRKKKEAVDGLEANKKIKSQESSKKKQKLSPEAQPIKHKKKTPKKNRSFDEDDEYRPGGKKRHRKLSGEQPGGKKATITKGPIDCSVCGTHLHRGTDLPKHQQTLKCRTAAYNIATTKAANITEEANHSQVVTAAEEKEQLAAGEGNSNSSVDAKFKANIAKRYEAERESGDTPPVDLFDAIAGREEGGEKSKNVDDKDTESGASGPVTVDTEEYATDGEDDDTDAAIKAAMQESLSGNSQDASMSDSDSPAAYIDPTPQPDIKPHHPLVQDEQYKSKSNTPERRPSDSLETEDYKERRPSDSLDTEDYKERRPSDSLDTEDYKERRPSDSLERQMAALHGAAGSFPSPPFSINGSINYMF